MTEQEAKKIVEQYWKLVEKAEQKLRGTIIPKEKCGFNGGCKIYNVTDLFLSDNDSSLYATCQLYCSDGDFDVAVPTNTFEDFE